jgi:hypothetical protein
LILAMLEFPDGDRRDLAKNVTWSSLASEILAIDQHGLATAGSAPGLVRITVMDKASGLRASAEVAVIVEGQPPPKESKAKFTKADALGGAEAGVSVIGVADA